MNDKETKEFEEITDENIETNDPEIEEIEEMGENKMKKLKEKLTVAEDDKKKLLDELQRTKADFLNARKRLEDERGRDKVRHQKQHIESLLPLCDSFQMAMADKETWDKADESWRTGIEGIHGQLMRILETNNVKIVDPTGETFDPHLHEAVGTEEVSDKGKQDIVISVVQMGYEMTNNDVTELIRPARVTTGIIKE